MRTADQSPDVFDQAVDARDDAAEDESSGVSEPSDTVVEPQSGAGEPPVGERRTSRRVRRAVAVGLLLVLAGTSAYAGWIWYRQHQISLASATALQTARDYAVVLTTLDAAHIDDNYRSTLDGATGEFKAAYSQGAQQLRQILIDNKAAGTGVVVDAAVKSATRDRAEVLLFVDQSITNAMSTAPRIDRNRIGMTLELIDGRWLASKVEIL